MNLLQSVCRGFIVPLQPPLPGEKSIHSGPRSDYFLGGYCSRSLCLTFNFGVIFLVCEALQIASSGVSRRAAYERAERSAGRDPDPKICARLERDEPLYPNCDMTIWLRTCDVESVVPVKGQVHGVIPLWIRGTLLRNGPGRLKFGDDEFLHLFDASALLHRYAIADGTATYQSRYLRTNTYLRNSAARRIVVSEFGTRACPDPCRTIFSRWVPVLKKDGYAPKDRRESDEDASCFLKKWYEQIKDPLQCSAGYQFLYQKCFA